MTITHAIIIIFCVVHTMSADNNDALVPGTERVTKPSQEYMAGPIQEPGKNKVPLTSVKDIEQRAKDNQPPATNASRSTAFVNPIPADGSSREFFYSVIANKESTYRFIFNNEISQAQADLMNQQLQRYTQSGASATLKRTDKILYEKMKDAVGKKHLIPIVR